MTLQQDLGGGGGFPSFRKWNSVYFVSACFTGLWKLTYWMVKFSSSGDICIWRFMCRLHFHCTMRLSIELENFQILKSKGLVFAQF